MKGILQSISKVLDFFKSFNDHYSNLSVEQQKAMSFVERVKYYDWTLEYICIALMVILCIVYTVCVYYNTNRANRIFGQLNRFFLDDLKFARVGFLKKDGSKTLYIKEQNAIWFTTFATGRSSIESITVKVFFRSWFNPIAMAVEQLIGLFTENETKEFIQLVVKPNGMWAKDETSTALFSDEVKTKLKFIASIVHKSYMNQCRLKNYFLSLTHTTESDLLPREYVFMSETKQLNKFFAIYAARMLNETLARCSHFLQFISFTDLPDEKPMTDQLWESSQSPRCVIHCSSISNKKDIDLLKQLLTDVVEVYDTVTKEILNKNLDSFLTNDLLKRPVQLRKDELAKLIRSMKQREQEISQEKKAEEDKKKRREQRNNMNTEDFIVLKQKMREKRDRRKKNKMFGRI